MAAKVHVVVFLEMQDGPPKVKPQALRRVLALLATSNPPARQLEGLFYNITTLGRATVNYLSFVCLPN